MKKNLFILAAAALALASCSSDETVESAALSKSNAISFRPLVSGMTRATSLATTDLDTEGFYVTATYTTAGGSAYFEDQLYKYNGATGHLRWEPWNGSAFKVIYWPNKTDDVLDFHAYARATAKASQLSVSNTSLATENGCPAYTVTPDAAATSQIDFVYATLTGQDYQNTSMALTFNHVESQVSIQLKNNDSGLKFTISEVALCNIAQSGIFKNRDAAPTTNTTMAWGDYGVNRTYLQSVNLTKDGIVTADAAGESWILIPHTLAVPTTPGQYVSEANGAAYNGAYIRVKMKIQSTANNNIYYAGDSENWVNAIWPVPASSVWNPGYHYTYTIDLAGGGYYETNQETPSGSALDRVLDLHPITFASVDITDWTSQPVDVGM